MAASDTQRSDTPPHAGASCLDAPALRERLEEEINRAGRHSSPLGCLLVGIEELAAVERAHGGELAEQALLYVAGALRREFRRFDRVGRDGKGEFVVVLPGVDRVRGEAVARRTLARLHAIKIELAGVRQPLRVSVGIAAWQEGMDPEQLIGAARAATRSAPLAGGLPGSSEQPAPPPHDESDSFSGSTHQ